MIDLFGNDRIAPLAPAPPAIALGLFEAAAEREAIATGRPVSQELAELRTPQHSPAIAGSHGGLLA